MLTPEEIDALATRIVSGHQEAMTRELVDRLVSALVTDGKLSVKDMRVLEQVAAMNRSAVMAVLGKYRARIGAQAQQAVAEALKGADDADTEVLSALYPDVAVAGSSAAYARMARETASGVAQIIARDNLQMAMHATQVWYDVSAEAIVRWNHGAMTPDRIIGDAVARLSREAMTVIEYKSGARTSIDAAVRRHIVTQVAQASGRMTMGRLAQYGHDLVKTTAHFGARPEHEAWQGKVFSLSGAHPKYPEFASSTGYGNVTGLQGANCRHSFGPWYEGLESEPEKLPDKQHGMTSKELYEATQKQRRYEREIRETKAEIAALEKAGADTTLARLKLGTRQKRLKAYTDTTGLPRQRAREKAYGVGAQVRGLRHARPLPKRLPLPDRLADTMPYEIALRTGGTTTTVPGTTLSRVEVFAGYGTSTPLRVAPFLAEKYGGEERKWRHTKARGWAQDGEAARPAWLHWFEEESAGIVELNLQDWASE